MVTWDGSHDHAYDRYPGIKRVMTSTAMYVTAENDSWDILIDVLTESER